MLKIIKTKLGIKNRIQFLKQAILSSHVYRPKDISKFIFLCGANKSEALISERRNALIDFSRKHLTHTQFFLAEKMFATLQEEGHKGNILDIEKQISTFADHIVIVLESNSAFTELGAFAHDKELRKKLIVINDSKYMESKSFINLGPIKAIEEVSGKDAVVHYKMNEDGIHKLDAIGDTFNPLYKLLKDPLIGKTVPINLDSCNPAIQFDKHSAMFIHDLIYFVGPVLHVELIELLKLMFGDFPFKLKEHVAILTAFGSITRNQMGLYKSAYQKPYYSYKFDTNFLISTFRNYMLKSCPMRIYGY